MTKTLEERFIDFAKNLESSESIDTLQLTPEQKVAEKADFFFNHRRVICELKSLKKDTQYKVYDILRPHQDRSEWPVFYGEWEVLKILKWLPDGDQIHRKIFDAITSALERLLRKAHRQIKATKEAFNIQNAEGLLVILNDMVEISSPDMIAHKVFEVLHKRTPEGKVRFLEIAVVWIINETHFIQVTPYLKTIPSIILINPHNQEDITKTDIFVESIQPKWAAYNKLPCIKMKGDTFRNFQFKRISDETSKQKSTMTRSDFWRLKYKQNPYLRALNKNELLDFGQKVLEELTPQFLKGTPKKSLDQIGEVLKRWADFLEEINVRGIDMREFSA
jgi:hypothetical protein